MSFSHIHQAQNHGIEAFRRNPSKLLVLGTSHADTGYSTEILSEMGIDSFVLSFPQMNPIEIEVLLNHQFERFPDQTELIVIDLYPPHFITPTQLRFLDLFYALPFSGKLELIQKIRAHYSNSQTPFFWFSLLVRGRNESFLHQFWASRLMDHAYTKGAKKTNRSGLSPEKFGLLKNKFSTYDKMLDSNHLEFESLERIMTKLNHIKNKVIFISTPFASFLDRAQGLKLVKEAIKNTIESKGYQFIDTSDAFDRTNEHELFYDEHHFSEKGRKRHTEHFLKLPKVRETLFLEKHD